MTGVKFIIDRDFDYGIDVNETDVRLNAGSLVLIEPARDGAAGIPTHLVNYAADQARTITGATIDSIEVRNTLAEVGGLAERTAKGGLHGIYPQNLTSASPRGVLSGVLPDAINTYVTTNPDHSYYLSVLGLVTRSALTDQSNYTLAGLRATSNPIATPIVPAIYQASTGAIAGGRLTENNTLGRTTGAMPGTAFNADVAQSIFTPQSSTNQNSVSYELFTIGSHTNSSLIAGQPSWVMYSLYLEDLTVSGQTYEQAHEKSQAVFDSRFGQGGVYANDTWTNPT